MSKPVYAILRSRVLTEKSNPDDRSNEGIYTFRVDPKATKRDVQKIVENTYGVKVEKVNTLVMRGKTKRRGVRVYKAANYKKAIVKLAAGQKIKAFDEV